MEEVPFPWRAVLETAIRRWRLVTTLTLAGTIAVLAWLVLTPPTYRAQATILLGAQRISGPRTDAMPDRQIESELALLSSPALVRAVLAEGRAPIRPRTAGGPLVALYRRFHHLPPADPLDQEVPAIAAKIETDRIEETNVVEVAFRDSDPKRAADFVNALLSEHVARIGHINAQTDTRRFFEGQRELASSRLEAAQAALRKFHERQGSGFGDVEDETTLRKTLAEVESQRAAAETGLSESQARVAYLRHEISVHPATIATESETREDESVRLLESRLVQLELQRSELITKYTPSSTVISGLDRQIADTKRLLVDAKRQEARVGGKTAVNPAHQTAEVELVQRQADEASLAARVQALGEQQASLQVQIDRLASAAPELERLRNEEKAASDADVDYLHRAEEARLSRELDRSGIVNISVLERAQPPAYPEPSKAGMKLVSGLLASLLLGVTLALLTDRLSPAVNSGAQAEWMTGVRILESVP